MVVVNVVGVADGREGCREKSTSAKRKARCEGSLGIYLGIAALPMAQPCDPSNDLLSLP